MLINMPSHKLHARMEMDVFNGCDRLVDLAKLSDLFYEHGDFSEARSRVELYDVFKLAGTQKFVQLLGGAIHYYKAEDGAIRAKRVMRFVNVGMAGRWRTFIYWSPANFIKYFDAKRIVLRNDYKIQPGAYDDIAEKIKTRQEYYGPCDEDTYFWDADGAPCIGYEH